MPREGVPERRAPEGAQAGAGNAGGVAPGPAETAILQVLADVPRGVSLPWLAKRLGLRASQVLRLLAPLGNDGAGWLDVAIHEGQWRIRLTAAGAALTAVSGGDVSGQPVLEDPVPECSAPEHPVSGPAVRAP